jgi:DNA-binding NtrC family response regulator
VLAEHGARGALSPEAAELLARYDWPGNIRELRNVIERAAILCPPDQPVTVDYLPPLRPRSAVDPSTAPGATVQASSDASGRTLEDVERRSIEEALRASGGSILEAARALGIARGTLYRKIRKYGLLARDARDPRA